MNKNEQEFEMWLKDPHAAKLSDHYKKLARRYAFAHAKLTGYPIGRGLSMFMLCFNKRHTDNGGAEFPPEMAYRHGDVWFPSDMIYFWWCY